MSQNGSGPTSTARGEARDVDQLTGSIISEDTKSAPQSQGKFAPAITRAKFAEHRGNRASLSAMKRHRPHGVRAAGRRASPSTKVATPNWRDQLDPNPLNWRAHLAVHPAAEAFPPLSKQDLLELAGDIKRNGLEASIVVWSPEVDAKRQLLDGRNRLDALALNGQLAVDEQGSLCIKKQDGGLELIEQQQIVGGDPEKHAYSLNLHRRHLTPEQKRELIAKLLKAAPEKSDRAIGKMAKADKNTVASVRAEQEGRGEIHHVEKRTDSKGRKQPATKDLRLKRKEVAASRPPVSKQAGAKQIANAKPVAELLDAAVSMQEHNATLVEKLRAAEIKIAGLESEVEELKAENAKLREQLETARATSRPEPADDGLDIPECLRRAPKAV